MRCSILFLCLFFVINSFATIPSGYYNSANGKNERSLKTALHNIIKDHTSVGYKNLYTVYAESDTKNDTILDIYSTCTFFIDILSQRCGNYANICDCYNREHIIPQSWFNEEEPMKSDAFHIYPTDGKVNGIRSNYPHGETDGPSVGGNGLGKLGTCNIDGYNDIVFEPIDEYKGDIARSYFYFITRYEDKLYKFSDVVFDNNTYPGLQEWFLNLMIQWHRQDTVSEKELNRQEAIYKFQNNRNPFIDHPELVEHIWGNQKNIIWGTTTALENVNNYFELHLLDNAFFISSDYETEIEYTLYDISGQLITKQNITPDEIISLRNLQRGMYIITIITNNNSKSYKIII